MKKTKFKGVFMLLLTAFIWGSAFVAQSKGMDNVEAFTFNGLRTLLGALVLLPFILIRDSVANKKATEEERAKKKIADKKTIIYGGLIGVVFCAASNIQQLAFNYTTTGKIAFITALYMFFVPLIGLIFRKRVPWLTWICVICGFIGLYFLCIDPANDIGFNKGDLLALACAFFFAIHILLIEKYAPDLDGVKLSFVQFLVSGIITVILMFIFEKPEFEMIKKAAVPLLYAGIMSCGVAYTFQIIGQKYTEATVASLLLCMESVFAVICAVPILHESMNYREIIGCVIMFAAIILSQFSETLCRKKPEEASAKLIQ